MFGLLSRNSLRSSRHILLRRKLSSIEELKKTSLFDFHVEKGGKMVDFAGWALPVSYPDLSHVESHLHTRKGVSIFDVSHMLQLHIHGKDRIKFIESILVADVESLALDTGTLSLMTNEEGGIIDDCIVHKSSAGFLNLVCNAGCAEKDFAHITERREAAVRSGLDITVEVKPQHSLIAVQGPKVASFLQQGMKNDLAKLYFNHTALVEVWGIPCRVTRCGYTGEDGVEISVPDDKAVELVERLMSVSDEVKLAGLGARDSLRLEAGLCLYGNDINETTTPVEGALMWTISKRRRAARDFPGAEKIMGQFITKPKTGKRRVGLVVERAPARPHYPVLNLEGETIGEVTSGSPSPCSGLNIAMAYVDSKYIKNGTPLQVQVRKRVFPATKVTTPFVPTQYYNPPK